MKRPRFRIGTLMFLVLIAALVVALVAERRRSAKLVAEIQAQRDEARMGADRASYREQLARAVAAQSAFSAQLKSTSPKSPRGHADDEHQP